VGGKDILKKINLEIKKAEIHALIGFSGGGLNFKKSYLGFFVRSSLLSII
jgi:Fe-S cluster assembly ATPase SufC